MKKVGSAILCAGLAVVLIYGVTLFTDWYFAIKDKGNVAILNNQIADSVPINMNMEASINVYFTLANGTPSGVVPANENVITAHIGETVAFLPNDAKTRLAVDANQITMYTDGWNGTAAASESNPLMYQNIYQFEKAGEIHFLLNDINKTSLSEKFIPTYTFIVTN